MISLGDLEQLTNLHDLYKSKAMKLLSYQMNDETVYDSENSQKKTVKIIARKKTKDKNSIKRDSHLLTTTTSGAGVARNNVKIHIPSPSYIHDDIQKKPQKYVNHSLPKQWSSNQDTTQTMGNSSHIDTPLHHPNESSVMDSSYHQPKNRNDLLEVIAVVEHEFEELKSKYQNQLQMMQQNRDYSSSVLQPSSKDTEELVLIIQRMQQKGEQLRTLKSVASTLP
jgi:hypothetical protein